MQQLQLEKAREQASEEDEGTSVMLLRLKMSVINLSCSN